MKWMSAYFVGFVLLLAGILAALWKTGVLESIGAVWTGIAVVIALGIGVIAAVANSGRKESIEIQR